MSDLSEHNKKVIDDVNEWILNSQKEQKIQLVKNETLDKMKQLYLDSGINLARGETLSEYRDGMIEYLLDGMNREIKEIKHEC